MFPRAAQARDAVLSDPPHKPQGTNQFMFLEERIMF
jgi:hypothetical protein